MKPDCKYYFLFLILQLSGFSLLAQNTGIAANSFRNNIIKPNTIPVAEAIGGHNQKWLGVEYERFLNRSISVGALVNFGLFEDYTFIKYHDFFDEDEGFSFTRKEVKTKGYHFVPSLRYYFLKAQKKKGQGIYVAGNIDFNQYFKKSEIKDCYYNTLVDNIPIYTVDEVFSQLPGLTDLYFSFDCKLVPDMAYNETYRRQFLGAVKRLCEKYNMSGNVFIEGDLALLLTAREMGMNNKGVVVGSTVNVAAENHIFGIGTTVDTPPEEIDYAHSKGLYVIMWGLKSDVGNKKAIALNPDIIQTDKPIPVLMLFDRFNFDYTIP